MLVHVHYVGSIKFYGQIVKPQACLYIKNSRWYCRVELLLEDHIVQNVQV